MNTYRRTERGVTALEVVFGVAIAAVVLLFSTYSIVAYVSTGFGLADKTQALYLAEDALESVRYIRDQNWNTIAGLTLGDTYYLSISSTTVAMGSSTEVLDNTFTRSFTVTPVYRDNNTDAIVATGGSGTYTDSSSWYVTATVSWAGGTKSVSLKTLLANIEP